MFYANHLVIVLAKIYLFFFKYGEQMFNQTKLEHTDIRTYDTRTHQP